MNKVLLIGKLSDILRSIHENLCDYFSVQLSSMQLENIQGMVKIVKPDVVIVSLIGIEKPDKTILEWLNDKVKTTPIIVIGAKEVWDAIKYECRGPQFSEFHPPIKKTTLIEACNKVLNIFEPIEETVVKKVLIIDDDPAMLRGIKGLLREDYTVSLALDGESGIQKAIDMQPDIILLDYEMPGMNGANTFDMIMQVEAIKHIPVIFLTGVSDKKRVVEVMQKHPAGYILKPPNKELLLQLIEENIDTNE